MLFQNVSIAITRKATVAEATSSPCAITCAITAIFKIRFAASLHYSAIGHDLRVSELG